MDISHIITVYNKEKYLPDTIASLLNQEGDLVREFIFVDDVSTDRSIAVIEEYTRGVPNVAIIRNTENKGPSVRLNQGAKAAKGKYLHFLDSDDMIPRDTIAVMHRILLQTKAEFIYGKWKRTGKQGKELLGLTTKDFSAAPNNDISVNVSDAPLQALLGGRFIRMCTLVERELFNKAGGCDERVFVQDESLALRLAIHAKRFAVTDAIVNLVPLTKENLSSNKVQLSYDRFMAYRNALDDFSDLPDTLRRLMYRRATSSAYKIIRETNFLQYVLCFYIPHLFSKFVLLPVVRSRLNHLTNMVMKHSGNVRAN